jgi:predicted RNA-binding Zn-ribbon protein involved in translation (DUF1610 family)
MAGWLDGYADDDEDELLPVEPDTGPTAAVPLVCRHCGSVDLRLKSTSRDSIAVEFRCNTCGRGTTHHLPYGYIRAYLPATL